VQNVSTLPRVLLAGTHSSVGKTTVALGLMAALRRTSSSGLQALLSGLVRSNRTMRSAPQGRHPCRCGSARSKGRARGRRDGRIGVVGEPPPEEGGRAIDGVAVHQEPPIAEMGLIAKLRRRPLGRCPDKGERDRADGENLAPKDASRVHGSPVELDGGSTESIPSCRRNR